jgi:S-adenosylmethionine/arginine decarboxylase-like enzyme
MPTMPPQQTLMPALAHAAQRVEAVLVFARRDDVVVELGRGVEVVVVVIEAGVFQFFGLAFFQHAQRGAGFQTQRLHFAHHLFDLFHVAIFRAAPCGAHAETRRAVGLGLRARRRARCRVEDLLCFDAGVVARRLRAVAAIFLAAAGLDRQQRGQFDVAVGEVGAVHGFCARNISSLNGRSNSASTSATGQVAASRQSGATARRVDEENDRLDDMRAFS